MEDIIRKALASSFRDVAANTVNPYGTGGASGKIKDILKETDLNGLLGKRFFDIPFSEELDCRMGESG